MDVVTFQETHGSVKGLLAHHQEVEIVRAEGQRGGGIYIAIHHDHLVERM